MEIGSTALVWKLFSTGLGEVNRLRHERFGEEHILLSVMATREGAASMALDSIHVDRDAVRRHVEASFPEGGAPPGRGEVAYDERAVEILQGAMAEAQSTGAEDVTSAHVLLAALEIEDGVTCRILTKTHVNLSELLSTLRANPDED